MSLKRLTGDELAVYYIGQAIMRQLERAPRDPETVREIEAVGRWITHWLTPDEYHHVMTNTGWIFDPEEADAEEEIRLRIGEAARRRPPDDDGIPF
jgi:hypothetical protein